ncbi:unnamed protein product, partial [Prorocentrum cordatum]
GDILHVGPRRRGRLRRGQPQRTLVTLYSVLAARWRILQSLIESDFGQTVVGKQPSRLGRVHVSGGGACKYPPLFLNAMGLSIEPVKELRAMVEGLLFLQETSAGSRRNDDPQGDLYTVDQDGRSVELPWPDPLFPLILVSFGTGVSILRVDSAEPNDFVRVGGTACGGGTFLGLARALTSAETFGEALDLAEGGDASHADKLVQDIYGAEGSKSLGLPGGLTACNFGKLCDLPKAAVGSSARAPQCACSEKDLPAPSPAPRCRWSRSSPSCWPPRSRGSSGARGERSSSAATWTPPTGWRGP